MGRQPELPFSVKSEDESENKIISAAVNNKCFLQTEMWDLYKRNENIKPASFEEDILCIEVNMHITQVCDSTKDTPDDHRVYLRRISGKIRPVGNSKHKDKNFFSKFPNVVIPKWVDALFLRNNWVARELLADTFCQITGLKYVDSVWTEIKSLADCERKLKGTEGKGCTVVILFNHSIMPSEVIPSDTEAVNELIKEGTNTYNFLKRKAAELDVILVGKYMNFFPNDRFIKDVAMQKLCNGYPFKKHFDTDYLLLNNALSPFQDRSSKGWPPIVYPPNIEDKGFLENIKETYFFAKWLPDDPFCCYEVVGNIDKSSFIKIVSFIKQRDPKDEKDSK